MRASACLYRHAHRRIGTGVFVRVSALVYRQACISQSASACLQLHVCIGMLALFECASTRMHRHARIGMHASACMRLSARIGMRASACEHQHACTSIACISMHTLHAHRHAQVDMHTSVCLPLHAHRHAYIGACIGRRVSARSSACIY